MNPKIEQILKEGEICKQKYIEAGIMGPTGPQGVPGSIGPTGPTGPNFNASLYGNVITTQAVGIGTNVSLETIPVSNNITYANGTITLQESGLYFIDVDAYVRTGAGQLIRLEVRKISPTLETILPLSSGTYVNSGSVVDLHGNALFYGMAGDVITIINAGDEDIILDANARNALNLSIFKIAQS